MFILKAFLTFVVVANASALNIAIPQIIQSVVSIVGITPTAVLSVDNFITATVAPSIIGIDLDSSGPFGSAINTVNTAVDEVDGTVIEIAPFADDQSSCVGGPPVTTTVIPRCKYDNTETAVVQNVVSKINRNSCPPSTTVTAAYTCSA